MRSILPTIIIAVAIILSIIIAANALKFRTKSDEVIVVTGLAEKDFVADQVVWKGTFHRQGMVLKDVYNLLKMDEAQIRKYVNDKQIPDSSIVFSSVDVQRNYETRYDDNGRVAGSAFNGYNLTGTVTVDSKKITDVAKLSREITGLLEQGIELNSIPPSYYYSRLNELKIDLLANAAKDAKQRAESIAENSGADLGKIKKATMGVFQITGKNLNEDYSYGGAFNTTSKEKTASITLRVEYRVN